MVVKKNIYMYFKSHYFLNESCDLFNKCEKLYKLSHSKLEEILLSWLGGKHCP